MFFEIPGCLGTLTGRAGVREADVQTRDETFDKVFFFCTPAM